MFDTYIKLLKEYVSFKSISTDLAFKNEMQNTVEWLTLVFKEYGFTVETWKTELANPVVYAKYIVDPKAETVLVYGHYDVQPAEKADGWTDEPFDLSVRKGKLFARGVVDNKGQNLIHIVTVGELIRQGKLKYNVIFMIEGNEETSNPEMTKLVLQKKAKLKTDHIIISDGEIIGNTPTIEASLRGGFNMTIQVQTAPSNLHSGIFGGTIPNSANELSKVLAGLFDKNNKVTVPGFYDGVPTISSATKKVLRSIKTDKEIMKLAGVKALTPEKGLDHFTQTGLRPTLQVTGIKTGYIGEGYANIVPANAEARINVRCVGKQNPEKVFKMISAQLKKQLPSYVKTTITRTECSDPVVVDVESKTAKKVRTLLKKAYGKEPIVHYVGGGIPIVSDYKKTLGKDTLLISLGNDDCNMHGIDENFTVDLVKKGLKFSELFFSK
jgi:acetylornithine deacetylase/succinyl-diaminopimelate desuccinylase-like protein